MLQRLTQSRYLLVESKPDGKHGLEPFPIFAGKNNVPYASIQLFEHNRVRLKIPSMHS